MSDPIPQLPITGYCIYLPSKDLYSRGGWYIKTGKSKNAKIWSSLGHLRNHLSQHIEGERWPSRKYKMREGYDADAVIIELPSLKRWLVKDEYEAMLKRRNGDG